MRGRLQGSDTQLEAGLRAVDEQVDALAASAARALGSLWGGISGVARSGISAGAALTTKVCYVILTSCVICVTSIPPANVLVLAPVNQHPPPHTYMCGGMYTHIHTCVEVCIHTHTHDNPVPLAAGGGCSTRGCA